MVVADEAKELIEAASGRTLSAADWVAVRRGLRLLARQKNLTTPLAVAALLRAAGANHEHPAEAARRLG